jgi:hypothetical protein
MSTDETKKNSAFDERLRDGRPLMECTIEPPFKVVVTPSGVEIDAPCLQFNHTDALGVLRVTLTPMAALQLRNTLNALQFSEPVVVGSAMLQ